MTGRDIPMRGPGPKDALGTKCFPFALWVSGADVAVEQIGEIATVYEIILLMFARHPEYMMALAGHARVDDPHEIEMIDQFVRDNPIEELGQ